MSDEFNFFGNIGDNSLGSGDQLDALFKKLDEEQHQVKQHSGPPSNTNSLLLNIPQTIEESNINASLYASTRVESVHFSGGPIPFKLHHSKPTEAKQAKQKVQKDQGKDSGEQPKKKRHYKRRTKKNKGKGELDFDLEKLTTDDILNYSPGLLFGDKQSLPSGSNGNIQNTLSTGTADEADIQSFMRSLDPDNLGIYHF